MELRDMSTQKLTPDRATEIAFDLIGGTQSFERAEQLAWLAATHPPATSNEDYSTGLSLTFFLEAGASPTCHITGHQYLDAALYLDRYGFHNEAAILANIEISQWLAVFMGVNDQLSYFSAPAKHKEIGRWLMTLDATVAESGAIVSSTEERVRSSVGRHGPRSPYVSAWLATVHSADDLILPISGYASVLS
jgi:hypothetical protein